MLTDIEKMFTQHTRGVSRTHYSASPHNDRTGDLADSSPKLVRSEMSKQETQGLTLIVRLMGSGITMETNLCNWEKWEGPFLG